MSSTSFLGLSCPNLLVFLTLLFLGTCIIFFSQLLRLPLGCFLFILFSVPYFGVIACDRRYWIEVTTFFYVKTTTTKTKPLHGT